MNCGADDDDDDSDDHHKPMERFQLETKLESVRAIQLIALVPVDLSSLCDIFEDCEA
jgi:hypothetical protein